jgi:hypothetical protein
MMMIRVCSISYSCPVQQKRPSTAKHYGSSDFASSMLAFRAPSQLTARLISGLIFSSTTHPNDPMRLVLGMPYMIKLPTCWRIWPPELVFTLLLPRVLFREPRQISLVVEILSLLLVVFAPVQLHIDFPVRLSLSLMSP